MALQWSKIQFRFGASQDEESMDIASMPPQVLRLRNMRVLQGGSIQKRPGWALSGYTSGRFVQADDLVFAVTGINTAASPYRAPRELGSITGAGLSISGLAGSGLGHSLSEADVIEREPVWRDNGYYTNAMPDHTVSGTGPTSVQVIAWEVNWNGHKAIMAAVLDNLTRQPVIPAQIVSDVTGGAGDRISPRVIYHNGIVYVVYAVPSQNKINAAQYITGPRQWGATVTLVSDYNGPTGDPWDACELEGAPDTAWYLAYRSTAGNPLKVCRMVGAAVNASSNNAAVRATNAGALTVYAKANGHVWVAGFENAVGVKLWWFNLVTAAAQGNQVLDGYLNILKAVTMASVSTTKVAVAYTYSNVTTAAGVSTGNTGAPNHFGRPVTSFLTCTDAGVMGTKIFRYGMDLISKMCVGPNQRFYAAMLYDGGNSEDLTKFPGYRSIGNQTAFTVNLSSVQEADAPTAASTFRPVATWAIGVAGQSRYTPSISSQTSLSRFLDVGIRAGSKYQNNYQFALSPEFAQTVSSGAVWVGKKGVDLCAQAFETSNQSVTFATKIGRNVVFSGGVPMLWDGAQLQEYGFLIPPEHGVVSDAGAGGLLSTGTYLVQVVWEYQLATGDVVRSSPQLARTETAGNLALGVANHQISVQVPALSYTLRWDDSTAANRQLAMGLRAQCYHTEANGTTYRNSGQITGGPGTNGFVDNDPFATLCLSATINVSDTELLGNERIYTDGGVLPNYPLPALSYVHRHVNRIFGISAENRSQLVYTQSYDGTQLPGWHPNFVIDLEDRAVALATLDDKLVVLCERGVYVVAGSGPDPTGLNGSFSLPQKLNSPIGCSEPASVVSIPAGIVWLGATGPLSGDPESFVLLDRSLQTTRIGGPVQDTVKTHPHCMGVAVMQEREWVLWSLGDEALGTSSTNGLMVCYDWRHNCWSVDTLFSDQEVTSQAPSSLCVVPARFGQNDVGGVVMATMNDGTYCYHGGWSDPTGWIYSAVRTPWIRLADYGGWQRVRWATLTGKYLDHHELIVNCYTDYKTSEDQTFEWTDANTAAMATTYEPKMHIANQRGSAFQLEISDSIGLPSTYTQSFQLAGLTLEVGAAPGMAKRPQAVVK